MLAQAAGTQTAASTQCVRVAGIHHPWNVGRREQLASWHGKASFDHAVVVVVGWIVACQTRDAWRQSNVSEQLSRLGSLPLSSHWPHSPDVGAILPLVNSQSQSQLASCQRTLSAVSSLHICRALHAAGRPAQPCALALALALDSCRPRLVLALPLCLSSQARA